MAAESPAASSVPVPQQQPNIPAQNPQPASTVQQETQIRHDSPLFLSSLRHCENFYTTRPSVNRRFNKYNDIEIDVSTLPHESEERLVYEIALEKAVWEKRNEKLNIDPVIRLNALFWVALPVTMANFLTCIIQMGFTVHHATDKYFVLSIHNCETGCPYSPKGSITSIPTQIPICLPQKNTRHDCKSDSVPSQDVDMDAASSSTTSDANLSMESKSSQILPIPEYGTHYCRVECIVVHQNLSYNTSMLYSQTPTSCFVLQPHQQQQNYHASNMPIIVPYILMVKERFGKVYFKDKKGELFAQNWKFISGSVNSGEYFSTACTREIKEETGIDTTFLGVVGICNRLQTRFHRDEIVLSCLLMTNVISFTFPKITQGTDVRDVAWVPADCAHVTVANNSSAYGTIASEWLASAHKIISCVIQQSYQILYNPSIAATLRTQTAEIPRTVISTDIPASMIMKENKVFDPKIHQTIHNYKL